MTSSFIDYALLCISLLVFVYLFYTLIKAEDF